MTKQEQKKWVESLDYLTKRMESEVSNYALEKHEDLYDEDDEWIVRALFWSRGLGDYEMVITPYGQLKWSNPKTPRHLIVQVMNASVEAVMDAYEDSQN
jgi:hypothetical protein